MMMMVVVVVVMMIVEPNGATEKERQRELRKIWHSSARLRDLLHS